MTASVSEYPRPDRWRRLWVKAHRWLGLLMSLFLLVIGLTGSALVYWRNIDAWLSPDLLTVKPESGGRLAHRPLSELAAAARAAVPASFTLDFVYAPQHEREVVRFYANGPAEEGSGRITTNVFVNPYTARVTGTRLYRAWGVAFGGSLFGFLFNLHSTLLLGPAGIAMVGVVAALVIISIFTGLVLWWPGRGQWREAWTFRRHAGPRRLAYDAHKLAGVYSALVLLAVLVSGMHYNLPSQFRWVVEQFSPVTYMDSVRIQPRPDTEFISVDQALDIARERFPDGKWVAVGLAGTGRRPWPYSVTQRVQQGCCLAARRHIQIDPYTGEVLRVRDPLSGNAGDVFVQWQPSIHAGSAVGEAGRILVLLSGIACVLISATGIFLWLRKPAPNPVSSG